MFKKKKTTQKLLRIRSALFLLLSLNLNAHATETPFRAAQSIIDADPTIKTVAEFVSRLPESFKANWTAVFDSNGLARAFTNAENPRVIAFGEDSTVLTFSNCQGSSLDETYSPCNSVEAIDYNSKANKFELRVFSFPGSKTSGLTVRVEENPRRCLGCHQDSQGVKPIWEPYNFWTGTYGAVGDHHYEAVAVGSVEYQYYDRFINSHWNAQTGASKRDGSVYSELAMRLGEWKPIEAEKRGFQKVVHSSTSTPSRRLTETLYSINFERLAKRFVSSPSYEQEKFLLAWWSQCFDAIVPRTYNDNMWQYDFGIDNLYSSPYLKTVPYVELMKEMEAKMRSDYRAAREALSRYSGDPRRVLLQEKEIIYYNQAAPMLKRLLEILKLDPFAISSFSLTFDEQPYNFATPSFGLVNFQSALGQEVRRKSPELGNRSCDALQADSRSALGASLPQ